MYKMDNTQFTLLKLREEVLDMKFSTMNQRYVYPNCFSYVHSDPPLTSSSPNASLFTLSSFDLQQSTMQFDQVAATVANKTTAVTTPKDLSESNIFEISEADDNNAREILKKASVMRKTRRRERKHQ